MQSSSSGPVEDFEAKFLLIFTEELIRSTPAYRNTVITKDVKKFETKRKILKAIPRQVNPVVRQVVLQKKEEDAKKISVLKKQPIALKPQSPFSDFFAKQKNFRPNYGLAQVLSIPESSLPPHLQYLKPTPTPSAMELNLKKLTPLVRDPLVRLIECNGPNEKIIVTGAMGRKNTPIILNKDEIDETINTFSEAAKIPVQEGVFKVAYGKLLLAAIVSEVVGSKFVIKKMNGPQGIM